MNWLAGIDFSFSISKLGGVWFSHGFKSYMTDDATFVVNRFRWGSLGLTASMDEKGLADALVQMGTNLPRVPRIFERLDAVHNSDVDDVAELYLEQVKHKPSLLRLIKQEKKL